MLINIYPTYLSGDSRNVYFYFPPKFSHNMENQSNKLNIEFVEHMGYYILKTDVKGFDPETNGMSSASIEEKRVCWDEAC